MRTSIFTAAESIVCFTLTRQAWRIAVAYTVTFQNCAKTEF